MLVLLLGHSMLTGPKNGGVVGLGQLEGSGLSKNTPNRANTKFDWLKNMTIDNIVPIY